MRKGGGELKMNLYKLTQSEACGYDTYDSCIVAARTIEGAVKIHPDTYCEKCGDQSGSWAAGPESIHAEYVGKAAPGITQGVVLASFNAG